MGESCRGRSGLMWVRGDLVALAMGVVVRLGRGNGGRC